MESKPDTSKTSAEDAIKYILVPVDFTPESFHALRYANMIASQLGMGITMTHIHQPLLDPMTGSTFDVQLMQDNRERLQDMLTKLKDEAHQHQVIVPVESLFDVGDIQSRLFELATADKYSMVIMSTLSINTFFRRMLGSVSSHVSRHSPKPVIIVPIGAALRFPENIVVGVSSELFRDNALDQLLYLAADSGVILDFVHISNDQSEFNNLKAELTGKIVSYNKGQVQYNVRRIGFGNEFVDEALTDYANHKRADLVVLTTHYRSLIESIGHRSITKKMLLDPAVPIMVLHGHHEGGLGLTNELYDIIKEG